MRKLNSKNKKYIYGLALLTVVVLGLLIFFIFNRFRLMNVKYDIPKNSVTFNKGKEKVIIKENTFAKKDFLGNFYFENDNKKVDLGASAVIYNEQNILLLGTFYEVKANGETLKLTDYNEISLRGKDHIYKISDRKYLIIGDEIRSDNKLIMAKDFVIINLDKVGNATIYNNDFSTKSFKETSLITDSFIFDLNSEELKINNEVIDLSKINGSSNKYQKPEEVGATGGEGTGDEPLIDEADGGDAILPDKIVARKTTIIDYVSSVDEIEITYLIYDPFDEYSEVYFLINGQKTALKADETKVKITGLIPNTKYQIDFYYSYNENDEIKTNQFDTIKVTTKGVNGKITLAKIKQNEVQYKLIVDDIVLDECQVYTFINDTLKDTNMVTFTNNAFTGKSDITGAVSGDMISLKLGGCSYKGNKVELKANYNFKL